MTASLLYVMEHNVHIEPLGADIPVADGSPLAEALRETGLDFPCGGKGLCGNCHVELLGGRMAISRQEKELLLRKGLDPEHWRLACLARVTGDVSVRIPEREAVILSDSSRAAFSGEEGYAVAVDLGSTTIAVQLVDRSDGTVTESFTELNSQSAFGADIISRIAYAIQSRENADRLAATVRRQTGMMAESAARASGVTDIRNVTIVGNSAMHHLFCGLDATPLSAYPFQSPHNGMCEFSPEELGWKLPASCRVRFMPNISHFVGSDILAGIIHLKMHRSRKPVALMDLGTNGEMVIGSRDGLICTSTAAGPAFEGVNITNGMRATSGAVSGIDENTGAAKVIGNVSPTGICGSGLIDAVHYFLKTGRICPDGSLADGNLHSLDVAGGVALYDRDIREFQLAKAAVATGFDLLLEKSGISVKDLDAIYVAGGLGNYLDVAKAVQLGLIKADSPAQVIKAGNTALAGCKDLLSGRALEETEAVLPLLSHYSLETDPDFQDRYCENLFFHTK